MRDLQMQLTKVIGHKLSVTVYQDQHQLSGSLCFSSRPIEPSRVFLWILNTNLFFAPNI